jgi:hypothetical protein
VREKMKTNGAAILTRALGAALAFFFLVSQLHAQQVIEKSDKPLSKNAGRVLPLQPVSRIINQRIEWKGKIETENGIKVIKNPKEPLYGEIIFDLEEELSIGNENDENCIFYRGLDVAVDNEGNIFALDNGYIRIQKFDKNGRYLMTIGRKGQGPGEFQGLSGAFIDSKSNFYVNQGRSISVFDNNGKYIKSIPLGAHIYSFGITSDGNIIATTSSINPGKTSEDLIFFDSAGKRLKTLATFPNVRVVPAGGIALGARNSWAFYLSFCPITEKIAAYGFSSEYKLYLIDSSGDVVSIIEKEEIPEPPTKKDKERIIDDEIEFLKKHGMLIPEDEIKKAYPFPPHKSLFYGFMTDDLGNIYVSKISTIKKELSYDLFNPKGYYLYKVIMKEAELTKIIKNGCIYAMSMDKETGYFKVKRYRIKNWDQIKKEI